MTVAKFAPGGSDRTLLKLARTVDLRLTQMQAYLG